MANPSRLDKIQITGNANSGTATKVNVQEANGEVNTQTINTGFNKNIGLGDSDVVGANTLLNQYATTPSDWTAQSYVLNSVVFYAGKQWIAKIATVAGDVPAVSSKWEEITFEALANKTTTVDQTIIDGSTNAVSGNAVFDGLALKSNIGHTHVASQITDLSKASVGLGNVDNTSDLSKPLSTATINALATKAPISSVHNPVTLGTANGLSLSNQQINLGLASSGVTGALSGTDWNTFNGKFNTPTGLTTNYLPKWNGSGFGNSSVSQSETGNITVNGSGSFAGDIMILAGKFIGVSPSVGIFIDDTVQGMKIIHPGGFRIETANAVFTSNISAPPATASNHVVVKSQLDAAARPYKVYTAVLTQQNTNAPSAVVLENTLGGAVTWTRNSTGNYYGTLNNAFPIQNKIALFQGGTMWGTLPLKIIRVQYLNSDTIQIFTQQATDGALVDSSLNGTSIEIRVYL